MYLNILAEMARRRLTKTKMAEELEMSPWTFDHKLKNETEFTLNEIRKLQSIFGGCTFEYLFMEQL